MHTVRDGTQACARTHAYRQWSDFPRCLIWFMSSWRGTRDNKEREGIDSRCSSSLQFLPVPSHTNLTALSQPRELFCKSYSAHLPWKKATENHLVAVSEAEICPVEILLTVLQLAAFM